MARLEVDGFDAILSGLEDMIEALPELRNEILTAEADVIEPAVRAAVKSSGLYDTGTLYRSIGRSTVKVSGRSGKIPAIKIGPRGEHHRYLPSKGKKGIVTAGYVGYIYEYGLERRGIPARKWLSGAVEQSKGPAFSAAERVYDEYLKKNNL
ncbi:MAG: hypothetical protein IJ960_00900 [Oscillospiraceae bacterium]|nr:hypothetical protein [Oscillospiraceae bacterium]